MKTVCIDFDGVIHSYTTKWMGPLYIPDPIIPGAKEAIEAYQKAGFLVVVFSTRAETEGGRLVINDYLVDAGITGVVVTDKKPPALIYIDDRGFKFEGVFPSVEDIQNFKPWKVST